MPKQLSGVRCIGSVGVATASQRGAQAIDAVDDIDAPADYRRALVATLVTRALERAAAR